MVGMWRWAAVGAAVLVVAGCGAQAELDDAGGPPPTAGSESAAATDAAATDATPDATDPAAAPSPSGSAPCNFPGSVDDFYTLPTGAPTEPVGTVVRCQQRTDIPNLASVGTAYRVLYVTEAQTDSSQPYQPGQQTTPRLASGLVFVPTAAAPADGRRVVAWDHGTVGMGTDCTPSRTGYTDITPVTATSAPTSSSGFVLNMLANGWVVAATDYAGLGTTTAAGDPAQLPLQYLIGPAEAFDTINAVRAARNLPQSQASSIYAVYGQSQGGHASLFTGQLSTTYAPELTLVGVAASDPAAEMVSLVGKQWNQLVAWVLGPEVVIAWPSTNSALLASAVTTDDGASKGPDIAQRCVTKAVEPAAIQQFTGRQFFNDAITTNPDWQNMMTVQTPGFDASVPALVGQTTNDKIVLASTTAQLQQQWCAAGANLRMLWIVGPNPTGTSIEALATGMTAHLQSASVDAPVVLQWLGDRFNGTNTSDAATTPCSQAPPQPLS